MRFCAEIMPSASWLRQLASELETLSSDLDCHAKEADRRGRQLDIATDTQLDSDADTLVDSDTDTLHDTGTLLHGVPRMAGQEDGPTTPAKSATPSSSCSTGTPQMAATATPSSCISTGAVSNSAFLFNGSKNRTMRKHNGNTTLFDMSHVLWDHTFCCTNSQHPNPSSLLYHFPKDVAKLRCCQTQNLRLRQVLRRRRQQQHL